MARGNIYFVTKDNQQEVDFTEQNYYDRLDVINVDYVRDEDEASSALSLECFKDIISDLGADIFDADGDFGFAFQFDEIETMKCRYFRPKFEMLKEKVNSLDLSDIISFAPDLNSIINDNHGDLITLGENEAGSSVTMDDFVRYLESDVTYYVYKKTILIH